MQAQHPSSRANKAITVAEHPTHRAYIPSRRQIATAVVGAALIGYLVHKSPDARVHLEGIAGYAQTMGDLSEQDVAVVTDLLARLPSTNGGPA